jgi:hypothetical protein
MISSIFYFFGLLLLLFNFVVLTNYSKYIYLFEFVSKFKKVTGKKPEKTDFSNNNYEFFSFLVMVEFFNFSWFFFGLIGSNWLFFAIYFFLTGVFNFLINKITIKFISNSLVFSKLITVVSIITLLVFNHFHLHLNLSNLILSFFG